MNVPGLKTPEALSRGEGSGFWLAVMSALRGNLRASLSQTKGLGAGHPFWAWLTPTRGWGKSVQCLPAHCPATELKLAADGVSQAFPFGSPRDKVYICDMYS